MEHIIEKAHGEHISFMLWETDPNMRNKNKDLKMYVNSDVNIEEGDVISIHPWRSPEKSSYTVEEVVSREKSNMNGKDYLHVKASWRLVNLFEGI